MSLSQKVDLSIHMTNSNLAAIDVVAITIKLTLSVVYVLVIYTLNLFEDFLETF